MHFDRVKMLWNVNIHARYDRVYIVVYPDNTTFLFSFLFLLKFKNSAKISTEFVTVSTMSHYSQCI